VPRGLVVRSGLVDAACGVADVVVASIVVIREAEGVKITPKVVIAVVALAVAFSGIVVLALFVSSASQRNPVATFQVVDEQYKIELATPELVAHAEALLAGEPVASIPNGIVVRDDAGPNAPWSWHIDPATLEFADMTIEVCDGLPSHVEDGVVTSERYCPWSAEIVSID
jgi:hypothetical protein